MIKKNLINHSMGKKRSIKYSLVIELLFSIAAITWFFYPQFNFNMNIYNPLNIVKDEIMVFNAEFYIKINFLYFIYLIPILGIFKVIAVFLKKWIPILCSPDRFLPILLNLINSILILLFYIIYLLQNASSMRFFYNQEKIIYIGFSVFVFFNIIFIYLLLKSLLKSEKITSDFLTYKILDKTDRKKIGFFLSIQKKLIISLLFTIIILVSVLSYFVLNDYKTTIIKNVEYIGKTIAEQSASYFKENFNDSISINTYLGIEKNRNINYDLKFESLTLFKKQGKEEVYRAENSTDENILNAYLSPAEFKKYSQIQISNSDKYYDKITGSYKFISPIKLQNKLIGFSIVNYNDIMIYETYFKAQIRIILLTIIFMYIIYIMIYIIGNKIVSPLLYLRMNVRKISTNLNKMIRGEEKVSTALLAYVDEVKTNDEIKVLSNEIKNMTTVLKDLIPYISFSTLKHTGIENDGLKIFNKNQTFLFTDIRGFTLLCEGLSPKQIVEMINHYLEIQTEIILNNSGDIDKFVGDQIMAVFEGQDKEINACRASLELKEVLDKDKIIREKNLLTTVNIGIGINTGPVIFGSIGTKDRRSLTSIGDTVNLASRLEGANKEYGTKILITEQVHEKIMRQFICREIDLLTVKGKTIPVRIYEVLDSTKHTDRDMRHLKTNFEKALLFYRRQDWNNAISSFKKTYESFGDETSRIFMNRIKLFKNNPPPDNWDGVFLLNIK